MQKIDVIEKHFPTKKSISLAMVTLKGLKPSIWADELVQDEVHIEDLL